MHQNYLAAVLCAPPDSSWLQGVVVVVVVVVERKGWSLGKEGEGVNEDARPNF